MTDGAGESGGDRNLTFSRNVGIGAEEVDVVFSNQPMGVALCIFGISFAGVTIGIHVASPSSMGFSFLVIAVSFASLLMVLGVIAAALRIERDEVHPEVIATTANQFEPAQMQLEATTRPRDATFAIIDSSVVSELADILDVERAWLAQAVYEATSLMSLTDRIAATNPPVPVAEELHKLRGGRSGRLADGFNSVRKEFGLGSLA